MMLESAVSDCVLCFRFILSNLSPAVSLSDRHLDALGQMPWSIVGGHRKDLF